MGSELRRPLGISIVGGLVLSQLLTLYTTPVVYLYLDRLSNAFAGWGRSGKAERAHVAAAAFRAGNHRADDLEETLVVGPAVEGFEGEGAAGDGTADGAGVGVGIHRQRLWAFTLSGALAGFAGAAFSRSQDPELGLACLRAWNDWHAEEWAGPHPDRIIPCGIAYLTDPAEAVREIADSVGAKVAFFSLEMSADQLATRILAEQSGISSENLRMGKISQQEFKSLARAAGELSTLPLYIDDTPGLTIAALRARGATVATGVFGADSAVIASRCGAALVVAREAHIPATTLQQQHTQQASDHRLHPRAEQFHQGAGGDQCQHLTLPRRELAEALDDDLALGLRVERTEHGELEQHGIAGNGGLHDLQRHRPDLGSERRAARAESGLQLLLV